MKRFLLAILVAVVWVGCVKTPITGRKALLLLPLENEVALGNQAFDDVLAQSKPVTHGKNLFVLQSVGRRIAEQTSRSDWKWRFVLLDDPDTRNAFALPGGNVAVYTGMFPACRNEAGLATVMAHEIAHNVARHGGQRLSEALLIDAGLTVADISMKDSKQKDIIMEALGAGAVVGVTLPFSRQMEMEADRMGLIYMARAGYDPTEALRFWKRFAALSKQEAQPPELLSTHPTTARRIRALERALPDALKVYDQAPVKRGIGRPLFLEPLGMNAGGSAASPLADRGVQQSQ